MHAEKSGKSAPGTRGRNLAVTPHATPSSSSYKRASKPRSMPATAKIKVPSGDNRKREAARNPRGGFTPGSFGAAITSATAKTTYLVVGFLVLGMVALWAVIAEGSLNDPVVPSYAWGFGAAAPVASLLLVSLVAVITRARIRLATFGWLAGSLTVFAALAAVILDVTQAVGDSGFVSTIFFLPLLGFIAVTLAGTWISARGLSPRGYAALPGTWLVALSATATVLTFSEPPLSSALTLAAQCLVAAITVWVAGIIGRRIGHQPPPQPRRVPAWGWLVILAVHACAVVILAKILAPLTVVH